MNERTCASPRCDVAFRANRVNQLYCSPLCKRREREKRHYWNNAHRREAILARVRERNGHNPRHVLPPECTMLGCSDKPIARDVCQRHYRAIRRAEGAVWAKQGAGRKSARGRARMHGAEYEPIDPRAVFERDHWICGLCSLPVDAALVYPDLMSASLDHVVPLNRGGAHLLTNVQCSHLRCNLSKRDGVGASQSLQPIA